ncbi:MAG TPA: class I SAM-dependent methyltransferase [Azospirillum sp.]|nr:class I SAM-dependent methyltransferase [Azospirillum sp.]
MDHVAAARSLIASARTGRREHARIVGHLRRALTRDPADADALLHLAKACLLANDVYRAVHILETVAALAPGLPGLAETLSGAYRRDARYADAVRVAEAALARAEGSRADLLYDAALSHAYLGDAEAALAVYDTMLAEDAEHAAAWFGSHAPALELSGAEEALRRLRRAVGCTGANGKYWAFLCAYLRLLGRDGEARAIFDERLAEHPKRRPVADAVAAILPDLAPDVRLFGLSAPLLSFALEQAALPGLVLEFGVRRGTSINRIAARAGQAVHGFDSFEGLPEAWGTQPRGVLTTGRELPPVRDNVVLHAGWFEDTLPAFLDAHEGPVRFVNVDSDLYSSARTVLTGLAPRIRPGSVLVFDEFIGNRTWKDDEYRAFHEFAHENAVRFEIVAVAPYTKQVAIRITGIG